MSKTTSTSATTQLALPAELASAVKAAADKKATAMVALDLRKAQAFTDHFFICTGQNARQVKAIADAIEEALAGHDLKPAHVEGYAQADWILLDYFSFVVHVFSPELRRFYDLERLWGNAERVDLAEAGT
jgi:ribosome-associated protein